MTDSRPSATAIDALREAADLLERFDVDKAPTIWLDYDGSIELDWTASDETELRTLVRTLGSTLDSPWKKHSTNGRVRLRRQVGLVRLEVAAGWLTCDRVQVGTKVETVEKIVEPAQTETVEEEVPVYEWRCPDAILDGVGEESP